MKSSNHVPGSVFINENTVVVIQTSTGNCSWQIIKSSCLHSHIYACQCFYWKVCQLPLRNWIHEFYLLEARFEILFFYHSVYYRSAGFVATILSSSHDDLMFAKS